jgi:cytochrome c oxidase subunit III
VAITAAFLAVIATIVVWWLSHQRLAAKTWLEEGVIGDLPAAGAPRASTAKIGLGVFLAVAGSLFALFSSAYLMRMHMGADWRPMPVPPLLWLNTGVLVASSLALHRAQVAARRDSMGGVREYLLAGGLLALVFLAGQLLAWRQLDDAGYFLASNPANSFFYLLTAVHGLHVLGGLVALARAIGRAWRGQDADRVRLSVELCAIYWHFLLFVWLVLFALLLHH